MKNNQVLAFCIKAFFWIFALYILGIILIFSYFFPTFLREIGNNTANLVGIILYIVSSVAILILLYFYIYRHTFLGNKTDLKLRIFFLILFIIPELIITISSLDFRQGLSIDNLLSFLFLLTFVIIFLLLLFAQKVIFLFKRNTIKFTHRINGPRLLRLFILGSCYSILLICLSIFIGLIINPTFDKDYLFDHGIVSMFALPTLYPLLYKKPWATTIAKFALPLILLSIIIFNIYVEASLITLIPFLFIILSLLHIYKDKVRSLLPVQ